MSSSGRQGRQRPKVSRPGQGKRAQAPLVLLIIASVAAVAVAVSGVAIPTPALNFAQAGHWVAQSDLGLLAHIDGSTKSVDAQAKISGIERGSQVVQGATSGYVVGKRRIVEFGKSTLSVKRTMTPPVNEVPVALEAAGGPYLIYQQAGRLVRLGDNPATIQAGGALGQPVVTKNGTLWVQRQGSGVLCVLAPQATTLSCPAVGPQGHAGSLTVVGDRPVFVDTVSDTFRPVSDSGLGDPVQVGLDMPSSARIAPHDAGGQLAILDDSSKRLHFVDTAGLSGRKPGAPVSTDLPQTGDYRGPAASGSSVVLLDVKRNDVLTYAKGSSSPTVTPVPVESGEPRMSRGEDGQIYVDGAQGKHVMVVDGAGSVTSVPVAGSKRPQQPSNEPGPPQQSQRGPATPPQRQVERPLPPVAQAPPPVRVPRNPPAAQPPVAQPPAAQPPAQPNPPAANPPADSPPAANPPAPKPPAPKPPAPKPPKPPEPPQQPDPVPASPPGMPGSFQVLYDSYTTDAVASWTAAPGNGSPVTAYHMSWSEGSRSYSGGTTFAPIPDFGDKEPFEVTLVAENAAGMGTPAVTTTIVGSTGDDDENSTENIDCGETCSDDCDGDDDDYCSNPASYAQPNAAPNAVQPTSSRRRRRKR